MIDFASKGSVWYLDEDGKVTYDTLGLTADEVKSMAEIIRKHGLEICPNRDLVPGLDCEIESNRCDCHL